MENNYNAIIDHVYEIVGNAFQEELCNPGVYAPQELKQIIPFICMKLAYQATHGITPELEHMLLLGAFLECCSPGNTVTDVAASLAASTRVDKVRLLQLAFPFPLNQMLAQMYKSWEEK